MSYYDDYDDDCLSEDDDDVYYHNYSVDYANQILGGHHAITSCLPRIRRRHHRHTPRLVRVSTLDQMPIVNRHQIVPSLHSQPKFGTNQQIPFPTSTLPPRLPSLEETNNEMERRISRRPEPILEEAEDNDGPPIINSNNNFQATPSTTTTTQHPNRTLTEDELRQVQQQQEAFQQHLLNMQQRLMEQSNQTEEQQRQDTPPTTCSTTHHLKKRTKKTFHDLERDDDQAEIAELIENDPYFAAAMEDFARTHGLLHKHRHRAHSDGSSSSSSQHSQHLYNRHRKQIKKRPPSHQSDSSSSSSAPVPHKTMLDPRNPNTDLILLRELQGIRRVMEEYVHDQRNRPTIATVPSVPMIPTSMAMPGSQYSVPPVADYQPSMITRKQPQANPDPGQAIYQNVVNAVKEVIDRRSPSQREQPLKPSEIDSKLKHVYTRRPQISSSNLQSAFKPPTQQNRRRSSDTSTLSNSSVPPAPPYESLANFSSLRSTTNQNRTLSYGKQSHQIYDTLYPGHYLRLYTNKYN